MNKLLKILSCSTFLVLYLIVAVISLICSTEFFALAHNGIMSWVLAVGFEVGAMSCLLSTLILPKNKQTLTWIMFTVLTLFQCMSNTYMAFAHLESFQSWIDLFGLNDLELIEQKRVLAGISGAILPLVALGFIRIMVNITQNPTKGAAVETEERTLAELPSAEEQNEVVDAIPEPVKPAVEEKAVETPKPAEVKPEPKAEEKPEPAPAPKPQPAKPPVEKPKEEKPTAKDESVTKRKVTPKIGLWNPSTNSYM